MRYDTILLDSDQTLLDFAADERAALRAHCACLAHLTMTHIVRSITASTKAYGGSLSVER